MEVKLNRSILNIWVFGYVIQFKSPKAATLYSERVGHNPPLINIKGWRLRVFKQIK